MTDQIKRIKIDISFGAIIKVALVVLALMFIQRIQDIILMLFVVMIVVAALAPVIDQMIEFYRIPRPLAVTIIFGSVFLLLALMTWLLVPLMVKQIIELLNQPQFKDLVGVKESNSVVAELKQLYDRLPVGQSASDVWNFMTNLFGGVFYIVTVLVISLYLLLDQSAVKKFFHSIMPTKHREQLIDVFQKIGDKMGSWLRGQLILSLIVGLADMVLLIGLGVPYWLTIGIFAGLTEIIPYIGPFLGGGAALLASLAVGSFWGFSHWTVAIGVIIGFTVVQQLESNLLVPKVMEKTVGLNPVVIIVAMLIGANLFGLLGVILAVPVAAILAVIVNQWQNLQSAYLSNRKDLQDKIGL